MIMVVKMMYALIPLLLGITIKPPCRVSAVNTTPDPIDSTRDTYPDPIDSTRDTYRVPTTLILCAVAAIIILIAMVTAVFGSIRIKKKRRETEHAGHSPGVLSVAVPPSAGAVPPATNPNQPGSSAPNINTVVSLDPAAIPVRQDDYDQLIAPSQPNYTALNPPPSASVRNTNTGAPVVHKTSDRQVITNADGEGELSHSYMSVESPTYLTPIDREESRRDPESEGNDGKKPAYPKLSKDTELDKTKGNPSGSEDGGCSPSTNAMRQAFETSENDEEEYHKYNYIPTMATRPEEPEYDYAYSEATATAPAPAAAAPSIRRDIDFTESALPAPATHEFTIRHGQGNRDDSFYVNNGVAKQHSRMK